MKAIQKNDFLSRLDDEQTAMMVDLLAVSNFKPGEDVIKEGSEGDSMYIVAGEVTPRGLVGPRDDARSLLEQPSFCVGGELCVTQGGRNLRTLTTGDVFGELAILYNCKRTATVTGLPPGSIPSTTKAARSPQSGLYILTTKRFCPRRSKDGRAPVVHGEADLQDHHHQQVQEEARAAPGLPEDVRLVPLWKSLPLRPEDLFLFFF